MNGQKSHTATAKPDIEMAMVVSDGLGSGIDSFQVDTTTAFSSAVWQEFKNRVQYSLPDPGIDGNKNIFVRIRDRSGRTSIPFSASMILDQTPPLITFNAVRARPYERSLRVEFTWCCQKSGIAGFKFLHSLDGVNFSNSQFVFWDEKKITDLGNGEYKWEGIYKASHLVVGKRNYLRVRASDAVGNLSVASQIFSSIPAGVDDDGDHISFSSDNCPTVSNPKQEDSDLNGIGDICQGMDPDGDEILTGEDNCPEAANQDQVDTDGDGIGDLCDFDQDGDGYQDIDEKTFGSDPNDAKSTPADKDKDFMPDGRDNCRTIANPEQKDLDGDGLGDLCDQDIDGDGYTNSDECTAQDKSINETCLIDSNIDHTGISNPFSDESVPDDTDNDKIGDFNDNCREKVNRDQLDLDKDGLGDGCDQDIDGDGYSNFDEELGNQSNPFDDRSKPFDSDEDFISDRIDNCPLVKNHEQGDYDYDRFGDLCDDDDDNDGYKDDDECYNLSNPDDTSCASFQSNPLDKNSTPPDRDGDFISDGRDNCPTSTNQAQTDTDDNGVGDACEPDIDADLIPDSFDNCPQVRNSDQKNTDWEVFYTRLKANPLGLQKLKDNSLGIEQWDLSRRIGNNSSLKTELEGIVAISFDLLGDICDDDDDNDGYRDDDERLGNQSDPFNAESLPQDGDNDFISDRRDNCPEIKNLDQKDNDSDDQGDVCDKDDDNDGFKDLDECINPQDKDDTSCANFQSDPLNQFDRPLDSDNDKFSDLSDNCVYNFNPGQEDIDGDGQGDLCDKDTDNDGVNNNIEILAGTNPTDKESYPMPEVAVSKVEGPNSFAQGSGPFLVKVEVSNRSYVEVRKLKVDLVLVDNQGQDLSQHFNITQGGNNPSALAYKSSGEFIFFLQVNSNAPKGTVVKVSAEAFGRGGINDIHITEDKRLLAMQNIPILESPPVIVSVPAPASMEKGGQVVGKFIAADPDGSKPVFAFKIRDSLIKDPNTGEELPPNWLEENTHFQVSQKADDLGRTVATLTVFDFSNTQRLFPPYVVTAIAKDAQEETVKVTSTWVVAVEGTPSSPTFTEFPEIKRQKDDQGNWLKSFDLAAYEGQEIFLQVKAIDADTNKNNDQPKLTLKQLHPGMKFENKGNGIGHLFWKVPYTLAKKINGDKDTSEDSNYTIEIKAVDTTKQAPDTTGKYVVRILNKPRLRNVTSKQFVLLGRTLTLNVDASDEGGEIHYHPQLTLSANDSGKQDLLGVTTSGKAVFAFIGEEADKDKQYNFEITAEDAEGGQDKASFQVTVSGIENNNLLAKGIDTIGATDYTWDKKDIIIEQGTVKIMGKHIFRNVWIKDGGVLSTEQPEDDLSQLPHLVVTGELIVEENGSINVSGKGYSGGLPNTPDINLINGATLDNVRENGALAQGDTSGKAQGGNHGGLGGFNPQGRYGNMYAPFLPGGGGGRGHYSMGAGGHGGGAVRIEARTIRLDGHIYADGITGSGDSAQDFYGGGGGAGGSIWLQPLPEVVNYRGTDENVGGDDQTLVLTNNIRDKSQGRNVHARGGYGGHVKTTSRWGGSGSGGRIAIYYSHRDIKIDYSVRPGDRRYNSGDEGRAGTIYLARNDQDYGTLFFRDEGTPEWISKQTELYGISTKKIVSVEGGKITLDTDKIPVLNGHGLLKGAFLSPHSRPEVNCPILDNDATSITIGVSSKCAGSDLDLFQTDTEVVVVYIVKDICWLQNFDQSCSNSYGTSYLSTNARFYLDDPLKSIEGDGYKVQKKDAWSVHGLYIPNLVHYEQYEGYLQNYDTIYSSRPLKRITVKRYRAYVRIHRQEVEEFYLEDTDKNADYPFVNYLNCGKLYLKNSGFAFREINCGQIILNNSKVYAKHMPEKSADDSSWGSSDGARSAKIIAQEMNVDSNSEIWARDRGYRKTYTNQYQKHTTYYAGHGGDGYDGKVKAYGNVYYPRQPGSGSNTNHGGGSFEINISGLFLLDGTIWAAGWGHASGGSVYIDMQGTGTIQVTDGAGYIRSYSDNQGSGGRISVVNYVSKLPSDLYLYSFSTDNDYSAQGTSFFRPAGDKYGTLVVDNHNRRGITAVLPLLPSGQIISFGDKNNTINDENATFPMEDLPKGSIDLKKYYFKFTDKDGKVRYLKATGNSEQQLELELPYGVEKLSDIFEVGADYQGVYVFQRVDLERKGKIKSLSPIVIMEGEKDEPETLVINSDMNVPALIIPEGTKKLVVNSSNLRVTDQIKVEQLEGNSASISIDKLSVDTVQLQESSLTLTDLTGFDSDQVSTLNLKGSSNLKQTSAGDFPGLFVVRVKNLLVEVNSRVDADGNGYRFAEHATETYAPGPDGKPHGTSRSIGAMHGGLGGNNSSYHRTYGDFRAPIYGGTSGHNYSPNHNYNSRWRSRGGGALKLEISEKLELEGTVSANAHQPSDYNSWEALSGAGGSVWVTGLDSAVFSGSGKIQVNGGRARGRAGGGGRVAVRGFTGDISTWDLQARGGYSDSKEGGRHGGAGTVFVQAKDQPRGDLKVDNNALSSTACATFGANIQGEIVEVGKDSVKLKSTSTGRGANFMEPNQNFDGLKGFQVRLRTAGSFKDYTIVTNTADTLTMAVGDDDLTQLFAAGDLVISLFNLNRIDIKSNSKFFSDGLISVDTVELQDSNLYLNEITGFGSDQVSVLNIKGSSRLKQSSAGDFPGPFVVRANNLLVEAGSYIDADGNGYRLADHATEIYAPGPDGKPYSASRSKGALHGGLGGGNSDYHLSYGDFRAPVYGGTSGNNYSPNHHYNSRWHSRGGGALKLEILEKLELEGTVSANAHQPSDYNSWEALSGAGGSVWVNGMGSAVFSGSGKIEANGGRARGRAGGGGRVAVRGFTGDISAWNLKAHGGYSDSKETARHGGAGTVFVQPKDQAYGDLKVGNNGNRSNSYATSGANIHAEIAEVEKDKVKIAVIGRGSIFMEPNDKFGALKGFPVRLVAADNSFKEYIISANTADTLTLEVGDDDLTQLFAAGDLVVSAFKLKRVDLDSQGFFLTDGLLEISNQMEIKGSGRLVAFGVKADQLTLESADSYIKNIDLSDHMTIKNGGILYSYIGYSSLKLVRYWQPRLEIFTKDFTIEEGGKIDLSNRGYPKPADCSKSRYSLGPDGKNGLLHIDHGASHGGVGGANSYWYRTYDDPQYPLYGGISGRCYSTNNAHLHHSGQGGGALKLEFAGIGTIAGSILSDGHPSSDANSSASSGGAGGSILLDGKNSGALTITGAIKARGASTRHRAGGGGRVALINFSGDIEQATLLASGGNYGNSDSTHRASAGSVFLRKTGQEYGDFILDNQNSNSGRWSPVGMYFRKQHRKFAKIYAVGENTVQIEDGLLREPVPEKGFYGFVGQQIRLFDHAEKNVRVFKIISHDANTLTLDTKGEDLTGIFKVDDRIQPYYQYNNVIVKNSARFITDSFLKAEKVEFDQGIAHNSASYFQVKQLSLVKSTLQGEEVTVEAEDVSIDLDSKFDVTAGGYLKGDCSTDKRGYGPPGDQRWGSHGWGASHGGLGSHENRVNMSYDFFFAPYLAGAAADCYSTNNAHHYISGYGGGVVKMVVSKTLSLAGSIKANGGQPSDPNSSSHRAGAAGSIWLDGKDSGVFSGSGTIQAIGGWARGLSGGGGRIAITNYQGDISNYTVNAHGGSHVNLSMGGGAGTIYTEAAGQSYGQLKVDNNDVNGNYTGLGGPRKSVVEAVEAGMVTLENRGGYLRMYEKDSQNQTVFYLRLVSGNGNSGEYRIKWVDGNRYGLEDSQGDIVTLFKTGDTAEPIYKLKELDVVKNGKLMPSEGYVLDLHDGGQGLDLDGQSLQLAGLITSGDISLKNSTLTAGKIVARNLILQGSKIYSPSTPADGRPVGLNINADDLQLDAGSLISANGRGYNGGNNSHKSGYCYKGKSCAPEYHAGSHAGINLRNTHAYDRAYGNFYFPVTFGAGSGNYHGHGYRGGGAIRLKLGGNLILDGKITANGSGNRSYSSGAGGSILIEMSGGGKIESPAQTGKIEARTWFDEANNYIGNYQGGNGYITLRGYSELDSDLRLNVLPLTWNRHNRAASVGVIYLKPSGSTYGTLKVDCENFSNGGQSVWSQAPAISEIGVTSQVVEKVAGGLRLAQDDLPVTNHVANEYGLEGLYAEVKGSWGSAMFLVTNSSSDTIFLEGSLDNVQVGDQVRTVHQFDSLDLNNRGRIHFMNSAVKVDNLTLDKYVYLGLHEGIFKNLTIKNAVVSTFPAWASKKKLFPLNLQVDNLVVESGGDIHADGCGYPGDTSNAGGYGPGFGRLAKNMAGSHGGFGVGGERKHIYGRYDRPLTAGSSGGYNGQSGGAGGGVIHIKASQSMVNDGRIRSNGHTRNRSGAGGSILLEASNFDLTGSGKFEAYGGGASNHARGGGGRIAVLGAKTISSNLSFSVRAGYRDSENSTISSGTYYYQLASEQNGNLRVPSSGSPTYTWLPGMGTYKIKLVDFPVITLMNSDGSEVDDLPVTDPDNGLAGFKGIYIQAETAADTWRGFRVKSSGANTLLLDESDFSGELKAGQKVEGLIDLASLNTNDNALMLSDSKLADSVDISAMDSRITRVTSGSQTLAFYAVTANYNHSREMCQYLFGGDLVSIHDQARHDLFSPNTGSNTTWHIGLNDSGSDGTFTWIDGSILDYNEPMGFNNTLEKDCVFYQKSTNNWQINYCTDRRYFVCAY